MLDTVTLQDSEQSSEVKSYRYLIAIEPLGFLYGSAGRFLSPENLVGRSGTSFPPSAATLSGLFAAFYQGDESQLKNLQLAGPFWAKQEEPQNFYVPTPLNCLVKKDGKTRKIESQMSWCECEANDGNLETGEPRGRWLVRDAKTHFWRSPPVGKFESDTWINIKHWQPGNWTGKEVRKAPWEFLPHLHPRLEEEQRRVRIEKERELGSLFLENAVQLDPDCCLVYLSNRPIEPNWYRFGGEGHLVSVQCLDLNRHTQDLLARDIQRSFALIVPAVWGSNRLSYREPMVRNGHAWIPAWRQDPEKPNPTDPCQSKVGGLLTQRPTPFRYRLGHPETPEGEKFKDAKTKRLSRGRYAMPAGSVYVLKSPLNQSWIKWPLEWFPKEGVSYKRWGCGLALPLESAIA